jgi:nucleotide-binding universal stress UspA family protein
MYKNILLAIDLNDETSCGKPLLSAVELARTLSARLHVLTVVREVEAILGAAQCRSAMRSSHRIWKTGSLP